MTEIRQAGVLGTAEPDIIVPFGGVVPVAVGRSQVVRFVVPRTAAKNRDPHIPPLVKGID